MLNQLVSGLPTNLGADATAKRAIVARHGELRLAGDPTGPGRGDASNQLAEFRAPCGPGANRHLSAYHEPSPSQAEALPCGKTVGRSEAWPEPEQIGPTGVGEQSTLPEGTALQRPGLLGDLLGGNVCCVFICFGPGSGREPNETFGLVDEAGVCDERLVDGDVIRLAF